MLDEYLEYEIMQLDPIDYSTYLTEINDNLLLLINEVQWFKAIVWYFGILALATLVIVIIYSVFKKFLY